MCVFFCAPRGVPLYHRENLSFAQVLYLFFVICCSEVDGAVVVVVFVLVALKSTVLRFPGSNRCSDVALYVIKRSNRCIGRCSARHKTVSPG